MKLLNRKKVNPSIPIYTGKENEDVILLQLFQYNKNNFTEDANYTVDKLEKIPDDGNMYWINSHGIHEPEKIHEICKKVGIHHLAIQDILDIHQRPKFQEYDHYWFFTLKSVLPSLDGEIVSEQISFILGKNYLVSFQERVADYFNHIRQRIRENIGIVRERGADYLLFLMLEAILDNYFKTLDEIEDIIKDIKLTDPNTSLSPNILGKIEQYKREVNQIKKTIVPIRDFVLTIERENFGMIEKRHIKYFFELKDLCLTLIDDCEQLELRLESNVNLFFSVQGHRMNQVMKTLTVVATIFIPLTFIAGIYGMNFANMPELNWKWGYTLVWLIMILATLGMLYYFKRKRWF